MLATTVVVMVVVSGAHVHVVGMTVLQSLLLVHVNLALYCLCLICTSGSKLSLQWSIAASQFSTFIAVSSHVNFTSQFFIPVGDVVHVV